jgi:hypothetical protein
MANQTPRAGRQRLRAAAVMLALLGGWCLSSPPARAIEIECIEASKYKYLYQLFNNNRARLAAFLRVDARQLPDGEKCRAVIIRGRVDSASASKEAGSLPDRTKLLQAIEQNGGWLATLYLISGGGNIAMGMELAQLTRMFWLKTVAVNEQEFAYYPDFGLLALERPVPPVRRARVSGKVKAEPRKRADRLSDMPPAEPVRALATGWRNYQKAAPLQVKTKGRSCASACTFFHVAGIDRSGVIYLHRGRFSPAKSAGKDKDKGKSKQIDTRRTMTSTLEGMSQAEAAVRALYDQMDAGPEVVRLFQDTSTITVRPGLPARFPRYVTDYLWDKCDGDAIALERREAQLRTALEKKSDDENLRKSLDQVRSKREQVETCVAASHEAERLTQFAKYCPGGTCNRKAIMTAVQSKVKPLWKRN